MKVNLPKDYKYWFTISELEQAKEVIKCQKGDDDSDRSYERIAVNHALKDTGEYLDKIIDTKSETRLNGRVFDAYGDTGRMDVWMEIVARTDRGFIEVCTYLTDIWNIGSDTDVRQHMLIARYRRVD